MMNYKILQENTFGKSLKQIVSENREFTNDDINFFINPTNEYVEMPLAIKNMDSAMKLFIEEIDKNSKIGVLCDPDVDGTCSTTIMVNFLKEVCDYEDDNIEIFIQEGKAHGLSTPVFKQIKNSDIDFLIIPDAATNDEQQIKDLLKDGKRVLILDHHIPSDENMKTIYVDQNNGLIGVIVNNQFNDYANAGSGAYVVIKLQELSLGEYTYTQPNRLNLSEKETVTTEFISLQGLQGSVEYQAAKEWQDFLHSYDIDGEILAEIDNNPTGLEDLGLFYQVYTQEMYDKLVEIEDKYDLKLHSEMNLVSQEELDYRVGGSFMGKDLSRGWAYIYENGILAEKTAEMYIGATKYQAGETFIPSVDHNGDIVELCIDEEMIAISKA